MQSSLTTAHYSTLIRNLRALFYLLTRKHRSVELVAQYEREFAKTEGVSQVAATSMGRIALFHILKALRLRPGTKVLFSPVNIPEMLAIVEALRLCPVFVDFEKHSLFISISDLRRKAAEGAGALFLTYIAGQIGNLEDVVNVCKEHNIPLVQDCSQANLCYFDGKPIATFADFSFFSTCEFKFVHTFRGAVICANTDEKCHIIRGELSLIRTFPQTSYLLQKWLTDSLISFALNSTLLSLFLRATNGRMLSQSPLSASGVRIGPFRFLESDYHLMSPRIPLYMFFRATEFEARLGLDSLKNLQGLVARHKEIAQYYLKAFAHTPLIPTTDSHAESSYWRFPLLLQNSTQTDKFIAAMRQLGIFVERSGLSLLCRDAVPRASHAMENMVYLPCNANLSDVQAQYIAKSALSFLGFAGKSTSGDRRAEGVSVIVPALNEERNLRPTVEKLLKTLPRYWLNWEILLFNDGSTDSTGKIADALISEHPNVRAFHHRRPVSLGGVFLRGVNCARYDYVMMVHGQNDITEQTLETIFSIQSSDIVIPYQLNTFDRPYFRRILSAGFVRILNASFGLNLKYYNHYVLAKKTLIQEVKLRTRGYGFQAELLIKLIKLKQSTYTEVPVIDDFSNKTKSSALRPRNILSVVVFYFLLLRDIYTSPKPRITHGRY